MSDTTNPIATPVAKAAAALSAGAGTSVAAAMAASPENFLPVDLGGWMALAASAAAAVYTLHLLAEWYWKRVVRPCLVRRGWLIEPSGSVPPAPPGRSVSPEAE